MTEKKEKMMEAVCKNFVVMRTDPSWECVLFIEDYNCVIDWRIRLCGIVGRAK
jgi:hypothetical protein